MKRLLFLFFMTVGIIAQVSAQFRQVEGDPIDYSRLLMPREQGSYPVTYTIGHDAGDVRIPITFYGELIRTREINTKIREKAIQTALGRQGINRQQIAKWNEQVAQAKETNYSTEQFLDDIGKMSGYGNITDVIAMLGGVKDPKKWLQNQAEQQTSRESLIKELLSKIDAVGEAISGLDKVKAFLDKIDVLNNARERDEQKWANRVASYAAEGLAAFYKEANIALRQFAHGEDVRWMLRVQGKAVAPFEYGKVMCSQEWTLNMVLDKGRDPEAEDETMDDDTFFNTFEGSYYGWLEAKAIYDLSNYDAHYFFDDFIKLSAFNLNRIRHDGSFTKIQTQQDGSGRLSWTESHKPSKVASSFALPVKISIKNRKRRSYIYGDMKVYMGNEQWPSGETPQPQIKTEMQIDHRFKWTARDDEGGHATRSGREWTAGGYLYKETIGDYQTTARDDEGKLDQVFRGGGLVMALYNNKEFNKKDSTHVDNTSFAGSPNGTLQINLRRSVADGD